MTTIDVETLLRALGIIATKKGYRWTAKCPNPDHDDADPSWGMIDRPGDRKHGSHHCFSCKWSGGPWELAAAIWGCEVKEAGKRLWKMQLTGGPRESTEVPKVVVRFPGAAPEFKMPSGVIIPAVDDRPWYQPALKYLEGRGVTRVQADRWGLGYAIRGRLCNRVVVPVYTEGALRTYSARAIALGMDRYDQGKVVQGAQPKRALWGEPMFTGTRTVTVAEGVWSGMALERAGAPNPCALLGSELTPERARILDRFDRIIIATDPDKAGDRVAEFIAVLGRRATVARLRLDVSPDDAPTDDLKKAVDGLRYGNT